MTLNAYRDAGFLTPVVFPRNYDLTGYAFQAVVYASTGGETLLDVTATATENGSTFLTSENVATLDIKPADIDALPVDADPESVALLAFDFFMTSPDGDTQKIHGGSFRVWPLGSKIRSGSGQDITVNVGGNEISVEVNSQSRGPQGIEGPIGNRGWAPVYSFFDPSPTIRVLQLTGYTSGEGDAPTDNIGLFLGLGGLVEDENEAINLLTNLTPEAQQILEEATLASEVATEAAATANALVASTERLTEVLSASEDDKPYSLAFSDSAGFGVEILRRDDDGTTFTGNRMDLGALDAFEVIKDDAAIFSASDGNVTASGLSLDVQDHDSVVLAMKDPAGFAVPIASLEGVILPPITSIETGNADEPFTVTAGGEERMELSDGSVKLVGMDWTVQDDASLILCLKDAAGFAIPLVDTSGLVTGSGGGSNVLPEINTGDDTIPFNLLAGETPLLSLSDGYIDLQGFEGDIIADEVNLLVLKDAAGFSLPLIDQNGLVIPDTGNTGGGEAMLGAFLYTEAAAWLAEAEQHTQSLLGVYPVITLPVSDWNVLMSLGQSLEVGASDPGPEHAFLEPFTGTYTVGKDTYRTYENSSSETAGWTPRINTDFNPLNVKIDGENNYSQERFISSATRESLRRLCYRLAIAPGSRQKFVPMASGVGGAPIELFLPDTIDLPDYWVDDNTDLPLPRFDPVYINRLLAASDAAISARDDYDTDNSTTTTIQAGAFFWAQGESNYASRVVYLPDAAANSGSNTGVVTLDGTEDRYRTNIEAIRTFVHEEVFVGKYGMDKPAPMLLFQTISRVDADTYNLGVGMAQLNFALANRYDTFLIAGIYPYPKNGVHPYQNTYRWMGYQFGKVLNHVWAGNLWEPTRPLTLHARGTSVFVAYHVPVAPLVFDLPYDLHDKLVSQADRGFRFSDDSGQPTINSVEIIEGRGILFQLSRPLSDNPYLWYADRSHAGPAGGSNGGGLGSVRDSDPALSDLPWASWTDEDGTHEDTAALDGELMPLHNWSISFRLPVTVLEDL